MTSAPVEAQYKQPNLVGSYRSHLEATVASELSAQGVQWSYEQPAQVAGQACRWYLPDFTVHSARPELELPQWLECKPQDLLYQLRDSMDLTRRFGERFAAPIELKGCDSSQLKNIGVAELWKPKKLAEASGKSVLVVGAVRASSRLTVEMLPDRMIFSRTQPFANWLAIEKAKKREAERLLWIEESNRRQEELLRQRKQREIDAANIRKATLRAAAAAPSSGRNKWPAECLGCNSPVPPAQGDLRRVSFSDGSHQFFVFCRRCQ